VALYEISNIPGQIDFECRDETKRRVQNAKNLLMCRMGEIPYDRQRGLDQRIYDLPLNDAREALLPEIDRLLLWEPGVEAVSATAEIENGVMVIRAVIEC
jgi:hypothetical protein